MAGQLQGKRGKEKGAHLLPVSLFFLIVFLIASHLWSTTNIPQIINFQGRLTDNVNNPKTGNLSFTFQFFSVLSGGAPLPAGSPWSETQTITVTNGVFNAQIGS